jgi:flagellar biosynthesis protein FliR
MGETWVGQLPLLGLVLARCAGICALAPPMGWTPFPPLLRFGVAAVLAVPLALVVGPGAPAQVLAPLAYLGLLGQNLIVGIVLGAGLWLLVEAIKVAGHLTEQWLGAPDGTEEGPLTVFLHVTAVLFFVQLNGLQWLLVFLRQSCQIVPVATVGSLAAAGPWLQWPGLMLLAALRVATPLVLALLLGSLMAATLARTTSGLQVGQVLPTLRYTIALVSIAVMAPLLGGLMLGEMDHWARKLAGALAWLGA